MLCADDDPASLRLIQQVLTTRDNIKVLTASNGRVAVELARRHHPAVIVMDNNMPEMTGRQAHATLLADPATADIPVIALTATPADLGGAQGVFRVLSKPFEIGSLLATIDEALASSHGGADPPSVDS